jgi:hypothetical protein
MSKMINNEKELGLEILGRPGSRAAIEARLYRDTACGAWLQFTEQGVAIGSIVKGPEVDTETHYLDFPFKTTEFWHHISLIEDEADWIRYEWNDENHDNVEPMIYGN